MMQKPVAEHWNGCHDRRMRTLVLETSTSRGSMALFHETTLIEERSFQALRGHNSKIYPPLKDVLGRVPEGESLDRIIVGTGPGSYTGVRISIAIANALALSFEAELLGISSFLGPSSLSLEENYSVVGDARRGKWYQASVDDGRLQKEIVIEDRAEWESSITLLINEGASVISFDPKPPREDISTDHPCATQLGQRVFHGDSWEEQSVIEPMYLTAPFITQPKKPGKLLAR